MEKTLELYQEEYDKAQKGLATLGNDLHKCIQEQAKIRQKMNTIEKTQASIVKKMRKLKSLSSAPLGTDDGTKIKELNVSYLFKFSEDNEPIFTYSDYDEDEVKAYITPNGVFYTMCLTNDSISFSFFYWDGKDLSSWCSYINDWESAADDYDDKDIKKIIEKVYRYTCEKKTTEAMEKALEI